MSQQVEAALRHLSDELCPDDFASSILALSHELPRCPTAGFECRLGLDTAATDFQIMVPTSAEPFLGLSGSSRVGHHVLKAREKMRNPHGALVQHSLAFALEFDVPPGSETPRPPAAFATLRSSSGRDPESLASVAACIRGEVASAALRRTLSRCVSACPPGADIRHLGAMLSRATSPLRVNFNRTSPSAVGTLLERLGWTGDMQAFDAMLQPLAAECDFIAVACDFDPELSPRVGIELFNHPGPSGKPTWHQLAAALQNVGLCTEDQRNALNRWCGVSRSCDGADLPLPQVRFLSHFKLVVTPHTEPAAKAYVAFNPIWDGPRNANALH